MGARLGADTVTVHPGRRTAKRPPSPADFIRFDHYIGELRKAAEKNDIKICMENMEPVVNNLLCSPEKMRVLLDNEPWLYFTLDVSHALLNNEHEPGRFIDLCHDRLRNVHISRIEQGKPHFPLDRNPLMAVVMENLKDHGFSGSLTLEIEDLTFDRLLSSQEKVSVLSRDCAFMRESMQ
jgi:sugar phosphate isomerase/epimerase